MLTWIKLLALLELSTPILHKLKRFSLKEMCRTSLDLTNRCLKNIKCDFPKICMEITSPLTVLSNLTISCTQTSFIYLMPIQGALYIISCWKLYGCPAVHADYLIALASDMCTGVFRSIIILVELNICS